MAIYNMAFILALLLCCVLIGSGVKNNPSLFLENSAILCPQKKIEELTAHY